MSDAIHYGKDGREVETDTEGGSFYEYWDEDDEMSIASSEYEIDEDAEEVEAKAPIHSDEDVAKYEVLEEQLGHDQVLVSHVTRMYSLIYEKYRWAYVEAASVNPELPKPAAASKSKLIWHIWIQYLSAHVIWVKAKTIGDIGLGKVKSETVLLRYQEEHPDDENMTNKKMRRVLKNLACMLDAAKDALSDSRLQ
jgi:hypothetical protein